MKYWCFVWVILPMRLSTAGSPLYAFHLVRALLQPVCLQPASFDDFQQLLLDRTNHLTGLLPESPSQWWPSPLQVVLGVRQGEEFPRVC